MFFEEVLIPLIYAFFLFNVAFVLGYFVLGLIRARRNDFLFNVSYSCLLGYGILAYFALFLSCFGPLNKLPIFIFVLIVLVLGYHILFYFYRNFKKLIANLPKQTSLNKILLGFLVFLVLLGSLSALMPPFRGDVVYYHLPEAIAIAENGIFDFFENTGGGWSVLPLFMETFYAMLFKIYDFILAQLMHYQIFLAGILAIYVFLRDKFKKTHGLLACILIFTLAELIVNATTLYIDAAMVIFNIAGLLIFIDWFFSNKKNSLILSALLFGFAVSIKYLAFYNLLIVGFFFLAKLIFIDKKNFWQITKISSFFFGFLLLASGFWYAKNLIFYLNPVYPFFSNMSIRWKFPYPRTLTGFFTIPFRVFGEPHYYPILLGFLALPLVFLIKKLNLIQKNKKLIIFLFIYFFAFFALWFFIGSQVRRYSIDGQVILMILVAIILGTILIKIIERIRLVWLIILIILASLPLFFVIVQYENNYFFEIEKLQMEYLLGIKNKYDFYQFQNMGEGFLISEYLNANFQNEKIINSLCPEKENFFLKQGNQFVSIADISPNEDKISWSELSRYLEVNNINYLLVDWKVKEKNYQWRTGACIPDWHKYKTKILPLENLIQKHSELIFSERGIELYRINLE